MHKSLRNIHLCPFYLNWISKSSFGKDSRRIPATMWASVTKTCGSTSPIFNLSLTHRWITPRMLSLRRIKRIIHIKCSPVSSWKPLGSWLIETTAQPPVSASLAKTYWFTIFLSVQVNTCDCRGGGPITIMIRLSVNGRAFNWMASVTQTSGATDTATAHRSVARHHKNSSTTYSTRTSFKIRKAVPCNRW